MSSSPESSPLTLRFESPALKGANEAIFEKNQRLERLRVVIYRRQMERACLASTLPAFQQGVQQQPDDHFCREELEHIQLHQAQLQKQVQSLTSADHLLRTEIEAMKENFRQQEHAYQTRKRGQFWGRENYQKLKKMRQHHEVDMPALSMVIKLRLSPEKLKTIPADKPLPSMVVKLHVGSEKLHNLQSGGRLLGLTDELQNYDADMEDAGSTSE